jgi:hypothetical protein
MGEPSRTAACARVEKRNAAVNAPSLFEKNQRKNSRENRGKDAGFFVAKSHNVVQKEEKSPKSTRKSFAS